ncbi:MAG: TetR family transcriptional regulator C-terminal domain-containing protein [Litoreibacter sp.]
MAKQQSQTRIQKKNKEVIREAALDVFSTYGFRGSTLDQIAAAAGLSKPNLLYYFRSKDAIHIDLLSILLKTWLDPMREIDPEGDPKTEILSYMKRKLAMSRRFPRESRLFAMEIMQGAPRIHDHLTGELKDLVDHYGKLFQNWMDAGKLAQSDPRHLIFSIWTLTQHYADFDVQIRAVLGGETDFEGAEQFLETLYGKLLSVDE